MFPVKCCGIWSLIACTNPTYIGSELKINYNTIMFSPIKRIGPINIKKNIYGSIFIKENNSVKIVWLNKISYDINLIVLPRISLLSNINCSRLLVYYEIDETENWLTIKHNNDQYVFRRDIIITENNDTILKLFITQLVFDLIINKINHIQ